MASSGYLRQSMSSYYDFYIYWNVTSQSTANNTSTVSLTWGTQKKQANSSTYNLNSYLTAKYDSTTLKNAAAVQFDQRSDAVGTYKALYTTSVTVTHNNDGTKNLSLYGYLNVDNLISASNAEINSSVALPTIARASSISATNSYVGNSSVITINKNSPSFTSTLSYKISGQSSFTQIVSKTSSTSYSWTVPSDAYTYMSSSSKTVSITLQCVTYDGNTQVGSATTTTITATAKESECKPTVSTSVSYDSSTNTLTGVTNKGILNFSTATIAITATAKNGASISSRSTTLGGETKTGSSVSFTKLKGSSYTYSVTDSRGFVTSGTVNLTTVSYVEPTIVVTATPPNVSTGNTTITLKGNCYNGSFGSTTNAITLEYRYKENSAGTYTNVSVTPTITGTTYTATATIALDSTKIYNIGGRIKDSANTTYIYATTQSVSTVPIISWTKNTVDFNVPVTFNAGASGAGGGGGAIYATCSTGATTAAKVVSTSNTFTYPPTAGTLMMVKFDNANTSATTPTLNVNNTGAINICRYGTTTNAMSYAWTAGELVAFMYDGTYWVMVEGGYATATYYGVTKLQTSIGTSTTTALTPSAVNTFVKSGTWTPSVTGIKSSGATVSGNYIKIGNVCNINFYFTGTANGGGTSSYIYIAGSSLPFTPATTQRWYAGGGALTNGYCKANYVFTGWCIDTNSSNNIYARTSQQATSANIRGSDYAYQGTNTTNTLYGSGTIQYIVAS